MGEVFMRYNNSRDIVINKVKLPANKSFKKKKSLKEKKIKVEKIKAITEKFREKNNNINKNTKKKKDKIKIIMLNTTDDNL